MDTHEPTIIVPEASEPKPRSKLLIIIIAAALVVLGAGLVYYFVFAPANPQDEARQEAERVVAAVGKLILLPTGEQPIIATVADPEQLAGQPFFQNAEVGDKVLIYNAAKKAILYSPEKNIVVDVAPLSPGTPTPTPTR